MLICDEEIKNRLYNWLECVSSWLGRMKQRGAERGTKHIHLSEGD